jgi:hypothetical protein
MYVQENGDVLTNFAILVRFRNIMKFFLVIIIKMNKDRMTIVFLGMWMILMNFQVCFLDTANFSGIDF